MNAPVSDDAANTRKDVPSPPQATIMNNNGSKNILASLGGKVWVVESGIFQNRSIVKFT